jgi:NADPH:quinone reductase-like Zn-dependent oxidoreductase
LGLSRPGTFAEFVSVPATNVYPKPPHLDFNKAAALSLAHLTAWRMLFTRAQLKKDELLLIHGIGGGVALAGLQLALLAGAKVIVTSSSDQKLSRAIELGASHGINYKTVDDLASAVMELTQGQGVDVVMDTVGAATWPVDFSVVRRGGRIVLCGVTSGAAAQLNLQQLYWNQLTIMGSTMGSDDDYRQMLNAVSHAHLEPVVDSMYPLQSARDAMAKMEQGMQFGKIVLSIR